MKFLTVSSNLTKKQVCALKKEIEKAWLDPDYVIITNYAVEFQDIPIDANRIEVRRRRSRKKSRAEAT